MTDLRTAAQQALEALRVANAALGHPSNIAIMESAIAALRSALLEKQMSAEQISVERSVFEAWIGDNERGPTGYKTYTTEIAWRAWIYRAAAAIRSRT